MEEEEMLAEWITTAQVVEWAREHPDEIDELVRMFAEPYVTVLDEEGRTCVPLRSEGPFAFEGSEYPGLSSLLSDRGQTPRNGQYVLQVDRPEDRLFMEAAVRCVRSIPGATEADGSLAPRNDHCYDEGQYIGLVIRDMEGQF